jgi:hypothetical protein
LDWSEADLVLANSTCFDQTLLNQIAEKCSKLKKGSWMFTLTKKFPSAEDDYLEVGEEGDATSLSDRSAIPNEWESVMSIKREMSWGMATVHIQRKIR